jgi:hypothetical protein
MIKKIGLIICFSMYSAVASGQANAQQDNDILFLIEPILAMKKAVPKPLPPPSASDPGPVRPMIFMRPPGGNPPAGLPAPTFPKVLF